MEMDVVKILFHTVIIIGSLHYIRIYQACLNTFYAQYWKIENFLIFRKMKGIRNTV